MFIEKGLKMPYVSDEAAYWWRTDNVISKGKTTNNYLQHFTLSIKVITKLSNSEQSYKGRIKTHNYINRQNQSTTENCGNRNDPDLVQAFLKKLWVESDFKAPNLPLSLRFKLDNKGNNKITELRTILQRESPNS